MYGIYELLQRYGSRVILVEYLEDALRKKGLQSILVNLQLLNS